MKITARTEELIVQEVGGETLVYDLKSNHAHCLNPTAAFVWRKCDGRHSMEEIARLLQQEMNAPASDELVSLAVKQLEKAQLLQGAVPATSTISRRDMGRKLSQAGAVALLIPAVMSITAPPAYALGSCAAQSQPCNPGAGIVCCAGLSCVSAPAVPSTCLPAIPGS